MTSAKKSKAHTHGRSFLPRHFQQHHRFYAGAVAAVAAWFAAAGEEWQTRSLAAGDAFFVVYLILLTLFAARATPDSTMKYARIEDEGVSIIALLTLAAVGFSLVAIITILTAAESIHGLALVVAITSVPLGWLTVHGSLALHYARLYYAEEDDGGSTEGLEFPGDEEPDVWDFLYFSFVLGMTAQTSDVEISGQRIRRSALVHSIVSYFYNAVIIALTVNVAVQIAA